MFCDGNEGMGQLDVATRRELCLNTLKGSLDDCSSIVTDFMELPIEYRNYVSSTHGQQVPRLAKELLVLAGARAEVAPHDLQTPGCRGSPEPKDRP